MFTTVLFAVVTSSAIVNGDPELHSTVSRPYVVSVESSRGFHVSTGVLVAEDVVLTTAHNVDGIFATSYLGAPKNTSVTTSYNVRVGSKVVGSGGKKIQVKKNCPISGYTYETRFNDITILRLKQKVTLSEKVAIAKLPIKGKSFGNEGEISGWGFDEEGIFDTIKVKKLDIDKCIEFYNANSVPKCSLCIDLQDNRHSCLDTVIGDPLVAEGIVYGLISSVGTCGMKGFPAIIAKIPSQNLEADIFTCN